jgi:uncharacterized protein YutE (UPF0331/DUF86 family)
VVDRDVVSRRLLVLNECLLELSRPEAGDASRLAADSVLRAAVERWVQLAIEACIDVATHVIAEEGWTPPASGRDAFVVLAAHGRLSLDLSRRLGQAVGMRNILVHDYVAVDLIRLAGVAQRDVADLREFAVCAAAWIVG